MPQRTKAITGLALALTAVVTFGRLPAAAAPSTQDSTTWGGKPWPAGDRDETKVDRVVVHSTAALIDLRTRAPLAKEEWFKKDRIFAAWRSYGVNPHYYIDREGGVHRLTPEAKLCSHARGYNQRSIGIELAGVGSEPWMQKLATDAGATPAELGYTPAQYAALGSLLKDIASRRPQVQAILHSDIWERAATVRADAVTVRAAAQPDAAVTTKLEKGRRVWVRAEAGDWMQVEYRDGATGYLLTKDLANVRFEQRKGDPGTHFDPEKLGRVIRWTVDHGG